MSKKGLPAGIKMRHDAHYVEELAKADSAIGRMLPIDKLVPNPEQPRNEIGDLTELTSSIKEQGVLEPLLVQPRGGEWMIIAGERRWRASREAGLKEVPCIELDIDDKAVAEIALVENLQRKDLSIWEIADGLQDLADRFDYTHDQIAKRIGKSRTSVTESLSIAGLPEKVKERCREMNIDAKSTLVEIAREFDEPAMHALLDTVTQDDGAVARHDVRKKKKTGVKKVKAQTKEDTNVFEFKSEENNFVLRIKHDETKIVSRTDLLIALKEVFDSVKAGD